VHVSEEEAVDKVKTILYYKTLYHQIKNNNFENDIEDEQLEEIKIALQIKDMSRPSLNTMILMEDAANSPLLRNPSSFFSGLLTRLRHSDVRAVVFILVQNWKTINTTIKSQTSAIFIFKGFSNQQLHYILGQLPNGDEFDDIWSQYIALGHHGKMIINAHNGFIQFMN